MTSPAAARPTGNGQEENAPTAAGTAAGGTAGNGSRGRDPGASAERTRLAWRRTGLSATAVGLLMVRPAFDPDAGPAKIFLAALAMAGWAVLIALAYRRARGLRAWPPHPGRRTVSVYALIIVGLSAGGSVLVML